MRKMRNRNGRKILPWSTPASTEEVRRSRGEPRADYESGGSQKVIRQGGLGHHRYIVLRKMWGARLYEML